MSDSNAKDPAAKAKPMTAAEAAKRVKRTVIELVDGKEGPRYPAPKRWPSKPPRCSPSVTTASMSWWSPRTARS